MEMGEGCTSVRSLPPNNPPSHDVSTDTTGCEPAVFTGLSTAPIEDGESECVRVDADEGDSVLLEDAIGPMPEADMDIVLALLESAEVEAMGSVEIADGARGEYGFGLSLPVGPLPRAGLFAGGRPRALRRVLFSSSSSATLSSRAWEAPGGDQEGCLGEIETKLRTWRWAARLALKALWTSLARFGGRLSLRLRPRLDDIGSACAAVWFGGSRGTAGIRHGRAQGARTDVVDGW